MWGCVCVWGGGGLHIGGVFAGWVAFLFFCFFVFLFCFFLLFSVFLYPLSFSFFFFLSSFFLGFVGLVCFWGAFRGQVYWEFFS